MEFESATSSLGKYMSSVNKRLIRQGVDTRLPKPLIPRDPPGSSLNGVNGIKARIRGSLRAGRVIENDCGFDEENKVGAKRCCREVDGCHAYCRARLRYFGSPNRLY